MANHKFDYQGTSVFFHAGATTSADNTTVSSIHPTSINLSNRAPVFPVRTLSQEHWETYKTNVKRAWILNFGSGSPLTATLKNDLITFWRDQIDGSRRRFTWTDADGTEHNVRWLGAVSFNDPFGENTQYTGSIRLVEDGLQDVEPTWAPTNAASANNGFRVVAYTGTGATQTISTTIRPSLSLFKKRSSTGMWIVGSPSFYTDGDNFEITTTSFISATEETTTFSNWTNSGVDIETATTVNENTSTYVSIHFNATTTAFIHFARKATDYKNADSDPQGGTYEHNLGVEPGMVLARRITGDGSNWYVYHKSLGVGSELMLESSAAASANNFWLKNALTSIPFDATNFYWDYNNTVRQLISADATHTAGGGGTDRSFNLFLFSPHYVYGTNGDTYSDDPKNWQIRFKCTANGHVGSFNTSSFTPAVFDYKKWYTSDSEPAYRGASISWFTAQGGGGWDYLHLSSSDISTRVSHSDTGAVTADDHWTFGEFKSKAWCVLALGEDVNNQVFGKYTGTGASTSIANGLIFVPGAILIKRTDSAGPWVFADSVRGATKYVYLNSNAAEATGAANPNIRVASFGNSNVVIGTHADVNANGGTYIYAIFKANN